VLIAVEDDEIFYDKKPQRYAKDNRTAHLTARSDKSITYVTNNIYNFIHHHMVARKYRKLSKNTQNKQ